jgi:uncharacterized protein YuzE
MKEKPIYEVYYDEEADFLEVFFGEPTKCYAEEIEEGIFIRKDHETKEIKSVEILSFKKRGAQILKQILDKINMKFPLEIGF